MKKSLMAIGIALSALPCLARVMICDSNELLLDATVGDSLTVEPNWHAERQVDIRLSTVWEGCANGKLSINGVEETAVGENEEKYFYLRIPANSEGTYNCVFTTGDGTYKRTIVTTGARRWTQSGSALLDTYSSPKTIEPGSVENIQYSSLWDGDESAMATVALKGEEVKSASGEGLYEWKVPARGGEYTFTHMTTKNGAQVGETLTATFVVKPQPVIVRCEWNDFDNVLGWRPSPVLVTVYTNDVAYKTVSVSSNDNWKARITLDSLADDVALSCRMASDVKGYSSSVERYEYDRLADVKLSNSVLTRTGWHEFATLLLRNDIYTEDGWEKAADVKLGKAGVVKSNGIGEFFVITNQQTSEPGDNNIPAGGLSKFDTIVDYDGRGHTINTNELQTAFSEMLTGGCVFEYAAGDVDAAVAGATALPWQTDAPAYTNIGEYVVWYKVTNSNYEDFVHAAKVTIKPNVKVMNLRVTQIAPWGLAIDYNVEGAISDYVLEVKTIMDGGVVTSVAKTLLGDVGCSNGAHRVYWNMTKDGLSFDREQAKISVGYKASQGR